MQHSMTIYLFMGVLLKIHFLTGLYQGAEYELTHLKFNYILEIELLKVEMKCFEFSQCRRSAPP